MFIYYSARTTRWHARMEGVELMDEIHHGAQTTRHVVWARYVLFLLYLFFTDKLIVYVISKSSPPHSCNNDNGPHPCFKRETVGPFPSFFYNGNNNVPHPRFKRETVGPFPSFFLQRQQWCAPPSLQTRDGGAVPFFFFTTATTTRPTLTSNVRRWGRFLLFTTATTGPTLASNTRRWGRFFLKHGFFFF